MYQRRTQRGRDRKPYTITGVATKALVAYGVCRLSSWAWTKLTSASSDTERDNDAGGSDESNMNGGYEKVHDSSFSTCVSSKSIDSRQFIKKRRIKLQKCERETIGTHKTLLHSLKSSIEFLSDFSKQTKALKRIRNQEQEHPQSHLIKDKDQSQSLSKQELWNVIKIKSMTRMIGSIYAHTILFLVLTIQIHLLGGRIFREGLELEENSECIDDDNCKLENCKGAGQQQQETRSASHREVLLQTFEFFFQNGLGLLMSDVQNAVEEDLMDWEVIKNVEDSSKSKDEDGNTGTIEALGNISLQEFEQGIHRIRKTFEARFVSEDDSSASSLVRYMFSFYTDTDDDVLRFIVDETLDIIESPVFEIAKQEALDLSFNVLREIGYSNLFGDNASKSTTIPLASIMTKLKTITNSTFYSAPEVKTEDEWSIRPKSSFPNIYLYHLSGIESMKELGDVSFN